MPKTIIEHEPWCVKHANDGYGEVCHSVAIDLDPGLAVWGAQVEGHDALLAIDSGRIKLDNELDRMLSHLTPEQATKLARIFDDGGGNLVEAIYKVAEAMGVPPDLS